MSFTRSFPSHAYPFLLPRTVAALPLLIILASLMLLGQDAEAHTTLQIHDIMTNLPNSPYLDQSVYVSGIIVGVMNTGGFYISKV